MLREYDFTIITRGDLSDSDHAGVLENYENHMTKDGGEILKKDDWGSRKMAFPIKESFRGRYVNYDFVGTAENLAEMQRLLRIDDNVLRHLAVRVDKKGKIDVDARKAELAKKEADAKEQESRKKQQA